jgi:hypothetical protein
VAAFSSSEIMKHSLALLILLTGTIIAKSQSARVYSDGGDIFIERAGGATKLTTSEMDLDPVLSPSGAFVVYTRHGRGRTRRHYEPDQFCPSEPRPDELRRVAIDGSDDRLLLKGRSGGPEHQLCDFKNKQFSSDGRRLYFLNPAWATSNAHSTCAPATNNSCWRPTISWCLIFAAANTRIICSCCHTAIFCSAAAMTGTGSMIPPAKRSLDRSANSLLGMS